jgi:glutathione S-transferase
MNDLENVIPFVLLGGLYLATGPSAGTAGLLFKVFTAARYIHTFVYLFAVSLFSFWLNFICITVQY